MGQNKNDDRRDADWRGVRSAKDGFFALFHYKSTPYNGEIRVNPEEAAMDYDSLARRFLGDKAHTNFDEDGHPRPERIKYRRRKSKAGEAEADTPMKDARIASNIGSSGSSNPPSPSGKSRKKAKEVEPKPPKLGAKEAKTLKPQKGTQKAKASPRTQPTSRVTRTWAIASTLTAILFAILSVALALSIGALKGVYGIDSATRAADAMGINLESLRQAKGERFDPAPLRAILADTQASNELIASVQERQENQVGWGREGKKALVMMLVDVNEGKERSMQGQDSAGNMHEASLGFSDGGKAVERALALSLGRGLRCTVSISSPCKASEKAEKRLNSFLKGCPQGIIHFPHSFDKCNECDVNLIHSLSSEGGGFMDHPSEGSVVALSAHMPEIAQSDWPSLPLGALDREVKSKLRSRCKRKLEETAGGDKAHEMCSALTRRIDFVAVRAAH